MRSALAISLLIVLCMSGNAAAGTHHVKLRSSIARSSQSILPAHVSPHGLRVYRDNTAPGGFRTEHDEPVSYDDPSKFGGSP